MKKDLLKELNRFLGKASLSTYAGGGPEVDPEGPGFTDLEFMEGRWSYRDSYTGFSRSWGRETVWLDGKPFWSQLYGGGMAESFKHDKKFEHEVFDFLKIALSSSEKKGRFQPRGPRRLNKGDWKYACAWKGDITKFIGSEKILFKGKTAFTHDFLGGLII